MARTSKFANLPSLSDPQHKRDSNKIDNDGHLDKRASDGLLCSRR
jgi:hypothetical protein